MPKFKYAARGTFLSGIKFSHQGSVEAESAVAASVMVTRLLEQMPGARVEKINISQRKRSNIPPPSLFSRAEKKEAC